MAFTPTQIIAGYFGWTHFTPALPNFYWNVYSAEERVKKICFELHKLCDYANMLADNINIDHVLIDELQKALENIEQIDELDEQVKALQETADTIQGILEQLPSYDEFVSLSNDVLRKVWKPEAPLSVDGTSGQVLSTLGNGKTEWVDPIVPTDAQAERFINKYLTEHPEATTTVLDGAVTTPKIANGAVSNAKLSADGIARFNCYNIPYTELGTRTVNGCTSTVNSNNVVISGRPNADTLVNLILVDIPSDFPSKMFFDVEGLPSNVRAELFYYTDTYHSIEYRSYNGVSHVNIPSGSTRILLRLTVTTTFSGQSSTVFANIYTRVPNYLNTLEQDVLSSKQFITLNSGYDLDDFTSNGIYLGTSNATNAPDIPTYALVVMHSTNSRNIITQLAIRWSPTSSTNLVAVRSGNLNSTPVFGDWRYLSNMPLEYGGSKTNIDLNDVDNAIFLLADGQNTNTPANRTSGFVMAFNWANNWAVQIFITINGNLVFIRRRNNREEWNDWTELGSGGDTEITNVFNQYFNTYNVSATPTITADTNNYLAPTGDTTDMTSSIMTMLSTVGTCQLGIGTYYVAGIDMPANTSIYGRGNGTVLRLIDGDNKYAIKCNSNCTIRDLHILGSENTSYWSSETIGSRDGILWQGNFTQDPNYAHQPIEALISGVFLSRLSGSGVHLYDTGNGISNALQMCNSFIHDCACGINIEYQSEYCVFTDVKIWHCHWGCVNNGGNNMFSNCGFSGCFVGFLIDNRNGDKPNNAHGSANGCVFNHIGGNQGDAIQIYNTMAGYTFNGCQIFYGMIDLANAGGVLFTSCNFGPAPQIRILNGKATIFADDVFTSAPVFTITNNDKVVLTNCMTRSGDIIQL